MTVSSAVESFPLAPPAGPAFAADRSPLRLRNEFTITVHAPLDVATGFFGAHGERAWAGKDWDPQFLHPLPPEDRAGSVFLVRTAAASVLHQDGP
jgi:hypothetical protein